MDAKYFTLEDALNELDQSIMEKDANTREPNNETREDYVCVFIWDWQTWPRRCYQCGELEGNHQ